MTSKTSFYEFRKPALTPKKQRRTILKHELRRDLPFLLFLCAAAILQVLLVLTQLSSQGILAQSELTVSPAQVFHNPTVNFSAYLVNHYYFSLSALETYLLPIAGYLLAIYQFSYLFNRRAVDVFASLPVTRASIFSGKMRAALLILWVPVWFSLTARVLLNGVFMGFSMPLILEWIFYMVYQPFLMIICYLMTVWVCTLVGTQIEAVFYPFILLLAPAGICTLGESILNETIYGADMGIRVLLQLLFPFYLGNSVNGFYGISYGITNTMVDRLLQDPASYPGHLSAFLDVLKHAPWIMAIWIVLLIAVFFLSKRAFLVRPMELAGMRGASRPLHLVMQWFSQLSAAVLVLLICQSFSQFSLRLPSILAVIPAIFITCVVLTLVVYRRGNFSPKYLLNCMGVPVAAMLLLFAFIGTMGFGVYKKVPDVDEIQSVSISYQGMNAVYLNDAPSDQSTLTKPQVLELVTTAHQQLLDNFDTMGQDALHGTEEWDGSAQASWFVDFTYLLKNGQTQKRTYQYCAENVYKTLISLNEQEEFIRQSSPAFIVDWNTYDTNQLLDAYATNSVELPKDLSALQQAYQKDLLARTSLDHLWSPDAIAIGYIELNASQNSIRYNDTQRLVFPIFAEDKHTLAWLEENDLWDAIKEPDFSKITEGAILTVDQTFLDTGLFSYSSMASFYPNLLAERSDTILYEWAFEDQLDSSMYIGNYAKDDIESTGNQNMDFTLITDPKELQALASAGKNTGIVEEGDQLLLLHTPDERYFPLLIKP